MRLRTAFISHLSLERKNFFASSTNATKRDKDTNCIHFIVINRLIKVQARDKYTFDEICHLFSANFFNCDQELSKSLFNTL